MRGLLCSVLAGLTVLASACAVSPAVAQDATALQPPAQQSDTPSTPPPLAHGALLRCGDLDVSVGMEGEVLALVANGQRYPLAPVSARRGLRYVAIDDQRTTLWETDGRATLVLGGVFLPECTRREASARIVARATPTPSQADPAPRVAGDAPPALLLSALVEPLAPTTSGRLPPLVSRLPTGVVWVRQPAPLLAAPRPRPPRPVVVERQPPPLTLAQLSPSAPLAPSPMTSLPALVQAAPTVAVDFDPPPPSVQLAGLKIVALPQPTTVAPLPPLVAPARPVRVAWLEQRVSRTPMVSLSLAPMSARRPKQKQAPAVAQWPTQAMAVARLLRPRRAPTVALPLLPLPSVTPVRLPALVAPLPRTRPTAAPATRVSIAAGAAPAWSLDIADGVITFTVQGGDSFTAPAPAPFDSVGVRAYAATSEGRLLHAGFYERACANPAARRTRPTTVIVRLDGKTYAGCGARPG